jgi:hypothetical protein
VAVLQTTEQQLGLLVCGTAARRAAAEPRVRELAARSNAERLAAVLDGQRLLAIAGGRLTEVAPDAFPPAFHAHVAGASQIAARRAVAVDSVGDSLQRTLDEHGIANVPLKGTALARRLYGDLSHRSSADVDVLVGRDDLDAALAAVLERGWRPPRDPLVAGGLPDLHYTCDPPREWLPQIEVHWRVHWHETRFSRALLESVRADGAGVRRPAAAYDLAALLLFFARDGFIGLRYAADIAAWWDVYAGELQAGGLRGVVADHPEIAAPLRTAAVVSERLGGPRAANVLGDVPSLSPRETRAVRLANWTATGDPHQLAANRAFVDWLLRPPRSLRAYTRRHLRPPAEVVAKMYGLSEDDDARLRFWRVFHGPKFALRLGAASMSARRGHPHPPLPDARIASESSPSPSTLVS